MVSFAWFFCAANILDEPIDFRPDIATAPTIVRLLADKTGLKLKTNGNVSNDVVGVVAPQSTPRQIMDQLAYTIEAKWQEAGGEWTLVRTNEQIKAQQVRSNEVTLAKLKESIAKRPEAKAWEESDAKAVASRLNGFQRQNANNFRVGSEYTQLIEVMPAQRLLTRFLKSAPLATLAATGIGERHVFSTMPTKMQKPMPTAINGDIQIFVKENNALSDAWIEADDGTARFFNKPRRGAVGKLLISVSRSSLNGLQLSLSAYDAKGSNLAEAMTTVQTDFGPEIKPQKVAENDKLIELRPLSKALLRAALDSMAGRPISPPEELRQRFYHPKENEPISLVNTEGMLALAEAEKKPFIASFPEAQIFGVLALSPDGKITVRRFEQSLGVMGAAREEHDGWICYRDTDPAIGRRRRIDRAALDAYFRRIEKDKRASLDAFAEFVLKHPTPLEDTLFPIYMMLTGTNQANFQYDDDLNMVRLYGLMTENQRESLKRGDKLPITAFSPTQAQVIAKFIYGKRHHTINYTSPAPVGTEPDESSNYYNSLETEPTEAFPNGIADPFVLSARVSETPSWFRKEVYGETRPTTANQVAWEQFQRERQDLFPYMAAYNDQRQDGGYIQGQARQWDFELQLSKRTSVMAQLSDHTLPTGPFIKVADLPEEFKKEIAKELAQLRESYKNTKPGEFGVGRGSPPPR